MALRKKGRKKTRLVQARVWASLLMQENQVLISIYLSNISNSYLPKWWYFCYIFERKSLGHNWHGTRCVRGLFPHVGLAAHTCAHSKFFTRANSLCCALSCPPVCAVPKVLFLIVPLIWGEATSKQPSFWRGKLNRCQHTIHKARPMYECPIKAKMILECNVNDPLSSFFFLD